jgi:hypothetical protein
VATNGDLQSVHYLVLRLANDLTDVGDVLVQITFRGIASNRARIGIGHVGGGPGVNQAAPHVTVTTP